MAVVSDFVKFLAELTSNLTEALLTEAFHVPTTLPSTITVGPSAFQVGIRSLTMPRSL